MSEGVPMRRCATCGHVVFPPRPLCPRCGDSDWRRALARRGVVEEVTVRRPRAMGRKTPAGDRIDRSSIQLASVRSDLGPVITALAPDGELAPGMDVALESHASVGVARDSVAVRARRAP